jgi:hypothetical protein
MDIDDEDDTSDESTEIGSDELLSDENLRLPESAKPSNISSHNISDQLVFRCQVVCSANLPSGTGASQSYKAFVRTFSGEVKIKSGYSSIVIANSIEG